MISAEEHGEIMKTKITVDYHGEVFWGPPTRYKASCKINVKYFPFDVQNCSLKFSSWMYDGHQLNLSRVASTVDWRNYLPNGEWEVIKMTVRRCAQRISQWPTVTFLGWKKIVVNHLVSSAPDKVIASYPS